jgi:LemA protein
MNEVIKKLYARELGLIADKPVHVRTTWRERRARLAAKVWGNQSVAAKIAFISLCLAILSGFVYYYNFFIEGYFTTRLELTQIEAELQRRNDLIPNLVKAVNDYMAFENKVFQHAADVRSALSALGSIPDVQPQQLSLEKSLSKFQAVAENYPDLKASATYQHLMKELSDTETRIAGARMKYNQAANFYNSRLKLFPGVVFGWVMGFGPQKTFESEHAASKVPDVR